MLVAGETPFEGMRQRGDAAALCRDVAAAGMYSLRKGALVGSYAEV